MSISKSLTDLAAIEAARLGFNPQTQPLITIPTLPGIDQSYLQPDFIEAAFTQPVQWGVEPLFADLFIPDFSQFPQAIRSAVCVPLVSRPTGLHMLLTRRAGHLLSHAGQVCFPGGRVEPEDPDAIYAALRETHEEVVIEPSYIKTLGQQPIFITTTKYAMLPVVGLVQDGFAVQPDPAEVAEVFEVPLSVLMNPANHRLHHLPGKNGKERYYFSISWNGYFIWGATAALIRNFYHHLAAASQQLGRV